MGHAVIQSASAPSLACTFFIFLPRHYFFFFSRTSLTYYRSFIYFVYPQSVYIRFLAFLIDSYKMSGDEAPSLFERITLPSIPKEVGRKISQLEQEFMRAEIEQCALPFFDYTINR